MPVSVTLIEWFSLSALILMLNSSVELNTDLSVNDKSLILSKASDALEINSLKKTWKNKCQKNSWNHYSF